MRAASGGAINGPLVPRQPGSALKPFTYALAFEQGHSIGVAAFVNLNAAAKKSGAEILPVDSEHSAIHQALRCGARDEVRRIVLTSGKLYYDLLNELEKNPNPEMGE